MMMQVTRKPGVCLCGCGAELPVPRPCNARLATDACRKKRELEQEKGYRQRAKRNAMAAYAR